MHTNADIVVSPKQYLHHDSQQTKSDTKDASPASPPIVDGYDSILPNKKNDILGKLFNTANTKQYHIIKPDTDYRTLSKQSLIHGSFLLSDFNQPTNGASLTMAQAIENITFVNGIALISNVSDPAIISHLNIETIADSLTIEHCTIADMDFLANLKHVGNYVRIQHCTFANVALLPQLQRIGWHLIIDDCAMQDGSILPRLSTMGFKESSSITIKNSTISSKHILTNLAEGSDGHASKIIKSHLTNTDFITKIPTTGAISVYDTDFADSHCDLSHLHDLQYLTIDNCSDIEHVDFSDTTKHMYWFGLKNNPQLTTINGLQHITAVDHCDIKRCPQLATTPIDAFIRPGCIYWQ